MIAPPPIVQIPVSTTAGTAQSGLDSQRGGFSTPIARRAWLRIPVSGLRICSHSTATATPARIDGTNRTVRKTPIPGELGIQQERQPQAGHHEERHGEDHVPQGHADRLGEPVIGQHPRVVAETHEPRLGRQRPVGQADGRHQQDRQPDEEHQSEEPG